MASDQVIFEMTTCLMQLTAKLTLPTFAVVPDFVYAHRLFLFESRLIIAQKARVLFPVFKFGAYGNSHPHMSPSHHHLPGHGLLRQHCQT